MFEVSGLALSVIPAVMALVQVAKIAGLNSKYAPLLALVFGVGLTALIGGEDFLLQGILAGLIGVGLYSSGKTIAK